MSQPGLQPRGELTSLGRYRWRPAGRLRASAFSAPSSSAMESASGPQAVIRVSHGRNSRILANASGGDRNLIPVIVRSPQP
jgi:hypothetical protein